MRARSMLGAVISSWNCLNAAECASCAAFISSSAGFRDAFDLRLLRVGGADLGQHRLHVLEMAVRAACIGPW